MRRVFLEAMLCSVPVCRSTSSHVRANSSPARTPICVSRMSASRHDWITGRGAGCVSSWWTRASSSVGDRMRSGLSLALGALIGSVVGGFVMVRGARLIESAASLKATLRQALRAVLALVSPCLIA